MRIIKRNGAEENFNEEKILIAITKANESVDEDIRMTDLQIKRITESVVISCEALGRAPTVEEIQDLVEKKIMAHGAFEVAKNYITYRYTRSLVRKSNTTDDKILSLIECNNEEVKQVGKELDMAYILWSYDTLDWKTKDAQAVYDAVMSGAKDGRIILCHDLHKTTVDAMEVVIPALIEEGYQLVTVSELLTARGGSINAGGVYNRLK